MKRAISAVLMLVASLGFIAASGSAAQANHRCNIFEVTTQNADTVLMYNSALQLHISPRIYSSNATHCDRALVFYSEGWRFDVRACGNMWAWQVMSNGQSSYLSGPFRVCGGQSVVLFHRLSMSAIVRVVGQGDSGSREMEDAWIGRVRS